MSPWWGLAIALNPGLLFAVSADTGESVQVALMLLAFLAWLRGRWLWAGVVITLGCFTKEALLLLPLGLFLWEALRFALGERPTDVGRRLAALVCGPVLYGVWVAYCLHVFGALPQGQGDFNLGAPFTGWVGTFQKAQAMVLEGGGQVGMPAVALLTSLGGLLILGVVRALRVRSLVDPFFVLLTIVALCTNFNVLLFPKDLIRMVALTGALLPFVIAGRMPSVAARPGRC
jgi:hypothetical protein